MKLSIKKIKEQIKVSLKSNEELKRKLGFVKIKLCIPHKYDDDNHLVITKEHIKSFIRKGYTMNDVIVESCNGTTEVYVMPTARFMEEEKAEIGMPRAHFCDVTITTLKNEELTRKQMVALTVRKAQCNIRNLQESNKDSFVEIEENSAEIDRLYKCISEMEEQ